MGDDYYRILGIGEQASPEEIRRAYHRKALKTHPDHNKTPGASDQFRDLTEAYETLSDPDKRDHYDRYGMPMPAGIENLDDILEARMRDIKTRFVMETYGTLDLATRQTELRKEEYGRWLPGYGFYKWVCSSTQDQNVWFSMHSMQYTMGNLVYNFVVPPTIVYTAYEMIRQFVR